MCQKTFDGKKPYGFLKSVLAYLVRPKLTYAGKPVKLEKDYPAQPITAVRSDISVRGLKRNSCREAVHSKQSTPRHG